MAKLCGVPAGGSSADDRTAGGDFGQPGELACADPKDCEQFPHGDRSAFGSGPDCGWAASAPRVCVQPGPERGDADRGQASDLDPGKRCWFVPSAQAFVDCCPERCKARVLGDPG